MKPNTRRAFGRKGREDVGDDSPYFTGSSAYWRAPCLATQQGVGILSQRWPGTARSYHSLAPVIWSAVRGVRASKRGEAQRERLEPSGSGCGQDSPVGGLWA